jgi:exopolysaccharide biosynthesis polyprenyl glycosylphosphotransferase
MAATLQKNSPPRAARASSRPAFGIRPRAVRVCGLLAGIGRETACLQGAAAVAGWTVTSVIAATTIALTLNASLRPARDTRPVWACAPGYACVGLVTLMLEPALTRGSTIAVHWQTWLLAGAVYALLTCAFLACWAALIRTVRRRGPHRRAVVVCASEHGRRLANTLAEHPEFGITPVGFVDDTWPVGTSHDGLPVLGTLANCADTLRSTGARTLVVAGDLSLSRTLVDALDARGHEILYAPAPDSLVLDFVPRRRHVRSFPVLPMTPRAQRRPGWGAKRLLDIAMALIALTLTAPVLAACLLAARVEGGPGVLFRQRRVGLGGRCFEMLKIRTIIPSDPHESATRWSVGSSHFTGPVGQLLRRTSLDELPQLWNVLRGDMSMVGPRPERPYFVERFSHSIDHYGLRHRVPVGMTGWAQIHGLRGDTSIEDRARFDNHYIDTWSPGLDLRILWRTVACVLRLGGA